MDEIIKGGYLCGSKLPPSLLPDQENKSNRMLMCQSWMGRKKKEKERHCCCSSACTALNPSRETLLEKTQSEESREEKKKITGWFLVYTFMTSFKLHAKNTEFAQFSIPAKRNRSNNFAKSAPHQATSSHNLVKPRNLVFKESSHRGPSTSAALCASHYWKTGGLYLQKIFFWLKQTFIGLVAWNKCQHSTSLACLTMFQISGKVCKLISPSLYTTALLNLWLIVQKVFINFNSKLAAIQNHSFILMHSLIHYHFNSNNFHKDLHLELKKTKTKNKNVSFNKEKCITK